MKRFFVRGKAAPEPVAPPPQGFVQTAVGRVAPLAQSAAGRVAPLTASAADRLNAAALLLTPYATSAAGRITPFVVTAAGRVVPLAQSASGRVTPVAVQALGRVTPYTQQAVERVTPLAQQALDRVTPYTQHASDYAHQAADLVAPYAQKVGPLATAAKVRSAQVAVEAVESIGNRVDDALSQVTPTVEAARGKVAAAATPVVAEATRRGRATMAAARGELTLPAPSRWSTASSILPWSGRSETSNVNWVRRVAVVAAAGGVVALVVRQLTGSKDGDWQAARPTAPYAPSTPPATASPMGAEDAVVADDTATVDDLPTDAMEPAAQTPVTSEGVTTYAGQGAYVGSEPPEGFVIKGNERSMKYHTPESGGYAETTAEVWFSSEEAAQEAGFTRAQG